MVSFLIMISSAYSGRAAIPTITLWTDKQQYAPGEKGILYLSYYNNATTNGQSVAVEIKNITVTYWKWNAYIGSSWVGNQTTKYTDITIIGGGVHTFNDITFTVPSDGRAQDTSVSVEVVTDHGVQDATGNINVITTSTYMEQIVSLLTILVVLVIVSTIILAATIVLATRKPRIVWEPEQKK